MWKNPKWKESYSIFFVNYILSLKKIVNSLSVVLIPLLLFQTSHLWTSVFQVLFDDGSFATSKMSHLTPLSMTLKTPHVANNSNSCQFCCCMMCLASRRRATMTRIIRKRCRRWIEFQSLLFESLLAIYFVIFLAHFVS